MNERQRRALTHPLIADGSHRDEVIRARQTHVRTHPTMPYLLMSILAVDR